MTPRGTAGRAAPGVALLAAGALLQGCATYAGKTPGDRVDPWEKWNRKVFRFNERLDQEVLTPVATTYSNIVPRQVRRGIDNFMGNAADAWSSVNNFLQGKVTKGVEDMVRFGTNTVFGLAGFIDVATELGLDHQYEDFGQTLGSWGFGPGAYVVWPLFGPSSVRESVALPLDRSVSPALMINDGTVQWEITGLQVINTRANLLGATRVLDDIALDKYTFIRDAYLQRRRSLVYDGDAPEVRDDARHDADAPAPAPAAAASAPAGPVPAPGDATPKPPAK